MTLPNLAGVALLALAACNGTTDPDQIPDNQATGTLQVRLTSDTEPGDVDASVQEVWVRIDSVTARHEDEGWVELSTERTDLDLMADDGTDDYGVVGSAEVWTGAYDQVKIGIVDSWVVVNGVEQPLAFIGDIDPLDPLARVLIVDESLFVDASSTTMVSVTWDVAANLEDGSNGWSFGAETSATVDLDR